MKPKHVQIHVYIQIQRQYMKDTELVNNVKTIWKPKPVLLSLFLPLSQFILPFIYTYFLSMQNKRIARHTPNNRGALVEFNFFNMGITLPHIGRQIQMNTNIHGKHKLGVSFWLCLSIPLYPKLFLPIFDLLLVHGPYVENGHTILQMGCSVCEPVNLPKWIHDLFLLVLIMPSFMYFLYSVGK